MKTKKNYSNSLLFKSLLILVIAIFTITGCQESTNDTVEVTSDADITEAVNAQFATSEAVPAENIEVNTSEGVVTLTGSTTNLLAKRKATTLAQNVHGVLSVVNNVKVSGVRPDGAIETDVTQALSTDPATEALEISVDVQNGLVRLTGAVDSWQEKQLAAAITAGVKGVKEINNTILVQPDSNRSDEDIKQEVEETLMMNSEVRGNQISVAVDSNRVTLSGSIGSAYEKQLAMDFSHVVGVDSVVADELEVQPEIQSDMLESDQLDVLTDEQIVNAIKRAFTYDPRVPEDMVDVTIEDDIAILTGTVNNLNSKLAADSDARHTAGVRDVENNIEVQKKVVVTPEVAVSDDAIQNRVNLAVQRDPYLESTNLTIAVVDGIVVLEGTVNSVFKKNQAEEVARDVKGVLAINNNIEVTQGS
ncbi:BON domain-containing protein [Balneolaceae bacterium YR4-1]|uniref:BON domain-containing protein n=1 Tax=Halalkalibaculum roseum TaxID=2709311 RepID=A0A6M1SRF5_9BACT|nr:BON domain-containing protein [Halalkalibaculum roseum]NGP75400.1 BON domain-containing protein [Halalkalibaculum roseum]